MAPKPDLSLNQINNSTTSSRKDTQDFKLDDGVYERLRDELRRMKKEDGEEDEEQEAGAHGLVEKGRARVDSEEEETDRKGEE